MSETPGQAAKRAREQGQDPGKAAAKARTRAAIDTVKLKQEMKKDREGVEAGVVLTGSSNPRFAKIGEKLHRDSFKSEMARFDTLRKARQGKIPAKP